MIAFPIATELPPIIERATYYSQNFYPNDLVFEVNDGKLSVNRPEPFTIPAPIEILTDKPAAISDKDRVNLFVFDNNAKLANFDEYQTFILTNEDVIMIRDDQEGIRAFPLKDAENLRIDKVFVDDIVNKILPFAPYIVPVIIVFIFIMFLIFIPISKLLPLFFLSFLVMLVGRFIIKLSLPYGKYYQIGLHSMTLPTLIQSSMFLFDIKPPFAAFYSVFFLLYTFIILSQIKEAK